MELTKERIKYIIARLIDYADDAIREENNDFYDGKRLAYLEMLDVLKNELSVTDEDLKEFGLDIDIYNKIMNG